MVVRRSRGGEDRAERLEDLLDQDAEHGARLFGVGLDGRAGEFAEDDRDRARGLDQGVDERGEGGFGLHAPL